MILDTLAASTRKRIDRQKQQVSLQQMQSMAADLPAEKDFPFEKALRQPGVNLIAEIKRASPSKGMIAQEFPYLQIAREYEAGGVAAISVLTEPEFFLGRDEYLKEIHQAVQTPLLRKDFTLEPYQIYQAKVLGASAVLLICSLLTTQQIKENIRLCDELGLSALVEVHNPEEGEMALAAGARIVGVNNRNLKDFSMNLGNSLALRKLFPKEVLFVAESGISSHQDILLLQQAGVNGALVGEALMRSTDRTKAVRTLKGETP